ncbi:MAG: hypothetical protein GYB31_15420 [Bacteroidetes bacterium]|nr:hypothetical protein [Bacteroidota bacterium]
MKHTHTNPEKEARKSLDLLNQLKRPDGNPYMFSRVNAALELREKAASGNPAQIWIFGLASLLFLINAFAWLQNMETSRTESLPAEILAEDYIHYQPMGIYEDDLTLVNYSNDTE